MAGEVLVDALPYIDQGYDEPGIREAVMAMVEEETRRYRPTKNYLEHLPQLSLHQFESETMKTEFERLQSRLPMEMMSMKRYELPQPAAGKTTDVASWSECVDNSWAQLEHQATRIANLELMARYGCEAWKAYNAALVRMLHQLQKQLQDLRFRSVVKEHVVWRDEVESMVSRGKPTELHKSEADSGVNWQRKTSQTEAGEKLKNLEVNWVSLVSKNYEIERGLRGTVREGDCDSVRRDYDAREGKQPHPETTTRRKGESSRSINRTSHRNRRGALKSRSRWRRMRASLPRQRRGKEGEEEVAAPK